MSVYGVKNPVTLSLLHLVTILILLMPYPNVLHQWASCVAPKMSNGVISVVIQKLKYPYLLMQQQIQYWLWPVQHIVLQLHMEPIHLVNHGENHRNDDLPRHKECP